MSYLDFLPDRDFRLPQTKNSDYTKRRDPIDRSIRYLQQCESSYNRAMYNYAHNDPDGNTDINRAIFRLKYPK